MPGGNNDFPETVPSELPQDDFEGAAHRYETTELFLELLGIDSLERLPDLAPLLPDVEAIDEEY